MRFASLLVAVTLSAAVPATVQIDSGSLEGVAVTSGIVAFKGIPFAAPPVGELRWREPQPAARWTGVRPAREFGASCMQSIVHVRNPWTAEFMAHNEVSEDCLTLNVWTPAKSAKDRLPVFVYIYGGGFNEGSSVIDTYDGKGLASKGLVTVTLNYRLNVFGFFSHPELGKAKGNFGILDQIAALEWIQRNIAAFGGDPKRVTIAGQSAGASSVHALTQSPLAKGLFHRAIAQSGSRIETPPFRTAADQAKLGVQFAEAKHAKSLAELRAMPAAEIFAPIPNGPRFSLVLDDYSLPAQKIVNDVPTITGCNKDENGASPKPEITAEQFERNAKQRFGDEQASKYLALYHGDSNEAARDQSRTSMYLWAVRRAKTTKTKTFTYFWDHVLPGPDAAKYGAFHTSEVPYVLHTVDRSPRPFTDADRKIEETLSTYWANFAKTGDPNGKGVPHWPSTAEKPGYTMEVGDRFAPIPVAGSAAKQQFFETVFKSYTER